LIPYLEEYYGLSYTLVSLIFLAPFVGYSTAAVSNNWIHVKFGRRGIAVLGAAFHLVTYAIICTHPPYPVVVTILCFTGFGSGLIDAGWNAWVGSMANSNEVLGLLHGFYGLGAVISPLVATSMVSKAHLQWYSFYYVMVGAAALELVIGTSAFWPDNGEAYSSEFTRSSGNKGGLRAALTHRVTWIGATFLLIYVGAEVALGGWIVTFMIRIRDSDPFAAGISSSGFWIGLTVGRVTLGFITPKIGERVAVCLYLVLSMGLELLFWLVPHFIVSAIAVAFLGFFVGPLYPSVIVAMTRILPKQFHVPAVGFSAAVGGGGAAVFPFAVGAIAQARGVQVLQPIVLSMLVVLLGLWLSLPRLKAHSHET
jgi:fucose permease